MAKMQTSLPAPSPDPDDIIAMNTTKGSPGQLDASWKGFVSAPAVPKATYPRSDMNGMVSGKG